MRIGGYGVGFNFDDKHVYLAELRAEFGSTQMLRWAIEEIGAEGGPDALSGAISRALQKSGIRPGPVNVALPEQDSMVRYFEIPLLPNRERAGAIRYEAQKYVPFEAKSVYSDYLELPDKAARKTRVLYVVAKKREADGALEAVRRAGLKTKAVETHSLAYLRALHLGQPPKSVAAVVDLGADGVLQILMAQDRIILMTRRSTLPPPQTPASGKEHDAVLAELRLSLNYFAKTYKSLKIDQLVLCADLEKYRGLGAVLQQEFGIAVRSQNPLSMYGKSIPYSSGLLAAAGMSLWNTQKSGDRMNLFSAGKVRAALEDAPPMLPVEERELLQKWVITSVAVVAVFVFLVHSFMAGQVRSRRNVSAAPGPRSAYSSLKADQVSQKIEEVVKKRDFMEKLLRKRHFLTTKMSELALVVPEEIRLTVVDYGDNETNAGTSVLSMRIEGFVAAAESENELSVLNKFVTALTENEEFMRGLDEVRIASAQKLVLEGTPMLKFALDASSREKP